MQQQIKGPCFYKVNADGVLYYKFDGLNLADSYISIFKPTPAIVCCQFTKMGVQSKSRMMVRLTVTGFRKWCWRLVYGTSGMNWSSQTQSTNWADVCWVQPTKGNDYHVQSSRRWVWFVARLAHAFGQAFRYCRTLRCRCQRQMELGAMFTQPPQRAARDIWFVSPKSHTWDQLEGGGDLSDWWVIDFWKARLLAAQISEWLVYRSCASCQQRWGVHVHGEESVVTWLPSLVHGVSRSMLTPRLWEWWSWIFGI